MPIHEIDRLLIQECQLSKDRPILVGVSGGPDSVCLLDILHQSGYPMVAAHLNHMYRVESEEDEKRVEKLAAQLGIAWVVERVDVPGFARSQGLSFEEAARIVRYRFLFKAAREVSAQAVAVGHTADDQVETILLHLVRGTGMEGLAGMRVMNAFHEWDAKIPLIRPLLSVWKEETRKYCQERGLDPVEDQSNQERIFLRNRIRHEMIPYLEEYNPRFRQAVWRMAQAVAGDRQVIEAAEQAAWEQVFCSSQPDRVVLSQEAFLKFPPGLQRRIIRRAFGWLRPGLREVDFASVERAIRFVSNPPRSGEGDLILGIRVVTDQNQLTLATWDAILIDADAPLLFAPEQVWLGIPGSVELGSGWRITSHLLHLEPGEVADEVRQNDDPLTAWLDASSLVFPLSVRRRMPGDRFEPLGMGGHSLKLSDFMVNVKLPKTLRDQWPLVCSQGKIAWVAGYRIGDRFRVTETSAEVACLRLIQT